jgi:hypothetical protein
MENMPMPRNNLKRLPVAMLRRGLASFHPGVSRPMSAAAAGDGGQQLDLNPVNTDPRPPVAPALLPLVFEPDAVGGPSAARPLEFAQDLAA